MVNVEADCMVGPIFQRRAETAGVVYSMAYGDRPALICDGTTFVTDSSADLIQQHRSRSSSRLPAIRS
ncbi:hypothetical protein LFT48_21965 (plasmid) [Arthrobacter sp. FW305-123]|nr:hypothetical protein LFT48_21965 [Arthrobacter sp. FW305-123]